MKRIGRITFSILAGSILATAIWTLAPRTVNGAAQSATSQQHAQPQSASGTIVSFQSDSFTLRTAADDPQGQHLMSTPVPKNIAFLIDNNTTIDGKMTVGAIASVIYREDNGNNLAVNVIVDN
jgi:hypothetical protein